MRAALEQCERWCAVAIKYNLLHDTHYLPGLEIASKMITSLVPSEMAPPFAKYAHGVLEANTGLVLTSGQLATTKEGIVPDTAQTQAELIFCNIDKILAEAGTSRAGTLRINAYVTDRKHMAGYMSARDAWLADVEHLPASTLVIVNGFTRPEFFVEIEVTAIRVPPL